MIKLSNLLTEGRTAPIPKEDFFEIYNNGFSLYKPTIYRGLKNASFDFGYIEPSQFTRRSRNTENYYTFIIDNSDDWKEYPDRSKSLICSSNPNTADGFGDLYYVFFRHGSKLGVAPDVDFWHSFDETITPILGRRGSLKSLNKFYEALFSAVRIHNNDPNLKLDDSDFQSFKRSFEILDRETIKTDFFERIDNGNFTPRTYTMSLQDFSNHFLKSDKSLYEFVESLYDPIKNGFELKTVKPDLELPRDNEVWSNGDALLMRYELYKELEVRL